MPEIKCPHCGNSNINKDVFEAAVGASRDGKYPEKEEYIIYRCLECGREFEEERGK